MTKNRDRGPPPTDEPSRTGGRVNDPDLQEFLDEALWRKAAEGDYDGVRGALAAGADVHRHNELALSLAAQIGHAGIVRLLLAVGADKSVHDHKPLRDAEAAGHSEVVRVLRDAGSYHSRLAGDFERSIADRIAREECANGATESFNEVRDGILRMFEQRRAVRDKGPGLR